MKHVVITGGTRGIGFGLATQFLKKGCKVTISGTSQPTVDPVVEQFSKKFSKSHIHGYPCDIVNYKNIEALWDSAVDHLGKIDIWINNAGVDQERKSIWEMSPEAYKRVIETNILGTMSGSHVAFQRMLQQGEGQIFNMEGFGSNGMVREKMGVYGTSKSAVRYFTRSLSLEAKGTSVQVGGLSPGMVATDILKKTVEEGNEDAQQAKRIFNILADHVETVTPFLVDKILATKTNGAQIEWLTKPKIAWRFMSSPFVKREIFK